MLVVALTPFSGEFGKVLIKLGLVGQGLRRELLHSLNDKLCVAEEVIQRDSGLTHTDGVVSPESPKGKATISKSDQNGHSPSTTVKRRKGKVHNKRGAVLYKSALCEMGPEFLVDLKHLQCNLCLFSRWKRQACFTVDECSVRSMYLISSSAYAHFV